MLSRKSAILSVLNLVAVTIGLAGGGGPIPVSQLRQQSDVIAIGTITSIEDVATSEAIQLNVIRVLTGQLTSTTVTASSCRLSGIQFRQGEYSPPPRSGRQVSSF